MKILSILLFLCLSLVSGCRTETEVKGDVFIVTQGAGSYKLGLVQIAAFPEEKLKTSIEAKTKQIILLNAEFEAAMAEAQLQLGRTTAGRTALDYGLQSKFSANSSFALAQASRDKAMALSARIETATGEDFFKSLPMSAAATATTDADGKFILKLPKSGKYVLTARAIRKVADEDEKYNWVIYLDADGDAKNIILSNNNTADSDASESVFSKINTSKQF